MARPNDISRPLSIWTGHQVPRQHGHMHMLSLIFAEPAAFVLAVGYQKYLPVSSKLFVCWHSLAGPFKLQNTQLSPVVAGSLMLIQCSQSSTGLMFNRKDLLYSQGHTPLSPSIHGRSSERAMRAPWERRVSRSNRHFSLRLGEKSVEACTA